MRSPGHRHKSRVSGIVRRMILTLSAAAIAVGSMIVSASDNITSAAELSFVSSGTVTASSLNVRSAAGTSSQVLGYVYGGDTVSVTGSATDSTGKVWYRINFRGTSGYVSSLYIDLTETQEPSGSVSQATDTSDFEAYLDSQGFPESYKPALRQLHQLHPEWIFKAQQLNINWQDAMKAESAVGVNLVSKSSPDSWKSMDKGAYNWSSGTWYGLDGSSWLAASEQIIAYYMDPRNFLDDTYIFMFEQLSYDRDVHTKSGVETILSGTFMSGSYTTPDTKETKTYSQTVMEAASLTGVSPYHLAARMRQEMGVSGTELSFGTVPGYEGYFNFFNIQAYATSTMTARQMGARYASTSNPAYSLPWTNQYKAIVGGSAFVGKSYINRGQDTLYLQKFDIVDGGNGYFSHQYMTNIQAAASEAASMKKAYNADILRSELVFNIPVYDNMPATACQKPTSGNNNNYLASLSAGGFSLTPTYSMYIQSYRITVSADTSKINITATAKDKNAVITGCGEKTLNHGENRFSITVKATSGALRTYSLTVVREGEEQDFVLGDVNGDGLIDTVDALMILQYAAGNGTLDKTSLLAADVNKDGVADVVDALQILQYTAGTTDGFY